MGHKLYRTTAFQISGPYKLHIEFDDRTAQEIDFKPILYGELFGPLQDLNFFNQVRLDPEIQTLVWPNGADFDPETLRNWPDYRDAWLAAVQRWQQRDLVTHL